MTGSCAEMSPISAARLPPPSRSQASSPGRTQTAHLARPARPRGVLHVQRRWKNSIAGSLGKLAASCKKPSLASGPSACCSYEQGRKQCCSPLTAFRKTKSNTSGEQSISSMDDSLWQANSWICPFGCKNSQVHTVCLPIGPANTRSASGTAKSFPQAGFRLC